MLYAWWCRWKFEKVKDRRGRLLYILEVVICSAVAGAPFSLRQAKPSATFDWPNGHNNSTVAQSLRKSRKLHKPRRLSPSPFFPSFSSINNTQPRHVQQRTQLLPSTSFKHFYDFHVTNSIHPPKCHQRPPPRRSPPPRLPPRVRVLDPELDSTC
jgi:hypothetical protein